MMTAIFIFVAFVAAVYLAYQHGFSEGHKQGVLDYYDADEPDRVGLLLESIQ